MCCLWLAGLRRLFARFSVSCLRGVQTRLDGRYLLPLAMGLVLLYGGFFGWWGWGGGEGVLCSRDLAKLCQTQQCKALSTCPIFCFVIVCVGAIIDSGMLYYHNTFVFNITPSCFFFLFCWCVCVFFCVHTCRHNNICFVSLAVLFASWCVVIFALSWWFCVSYHTARVLCVLMLVGFCIFRVEVHRMEGLTIELEAREEEHQVWQAWWGKRMGDRTAGSLPS